MERTTRMRLAAILFVPLSFLRIVFHPYTISVIAEILMCIAVALFGWDAIEIEKEKAELEKRRRTEHYDVWQSKWYELETVSYDLSKILAELKSTENFYERLRNCDDSTLEEIVQVKWNGFSEEEQRDLYYLKDGKRDREDWIERTENHMEELIKELCYTAKKIEIWRRNWLRRSTKNGRTNDEAQNAF